MAEVIMLEPSDFIAYPAGGQTSFAKQMMATFGTRLALVGFTSDETSIGKWVEKEFDGENYKFFSIGRIEPTAMKPLLPLRFTSFFQILRHRKAILSIGIRNVFTQAPEALMAFHGWEWESICFRFAGIENSLSVSRYSWAKHFAGLYERKLCEALLDVDVILAAADDREIEKFVSRTNGMIPRSRIVGFPTRVDTEIFFPTAKELARKRLGLPTDGIIIVSCARISHIKGWEFVLEAFQVFQKVHQVARLIFVGDGEDRPLLDQQIRRRGLTAHVFVTGYQARNMIALYNNAADIFVNGSYVEGWPTAQLEALACGIPIVSTDVSGARDLIADGRNGHLVKDRDPGTFAAAMSDALTLSDPWSPSLEIVRKYALTGLAHDMGTLWHALA